MDDDVFLSEYIKSFHMQFENDIAGLKNLESRYLANTQKYAKLHGFNESDELVGLLDRDLRSQTSLHSKTYYKQDRMVEEIRSSIMCLDSHNYADGFASYVFNKSPIINPTTQKVLGTKLVASTPLLFLPANLAIEMHNSLANSDELQNFSYHDELKIKLTDKQHLVLFLILYGYSQSDVVKIFHLLEEGGTEAGIKDIFKVLKVKFGVKNKQELVAKAIKNGLHTHVPAKLIGEGSFILHGHEFKIK